MENEYLKILIERLESHDHRIAEIQMEHKKLDSEFIELSHKRNEVVELINLLKKA